MFDKYHLKRLEVFGSAARGELAPGSDIDLLVTPADNTSVAELLDMAGEAEELVGRRVDFVIRSRVEASPNPYARQHILDNALLLHGS